MIEEETSDGDKADITPAFFEVEIIVSFTDLNFPFLQSWRYLMKVELDVYEDRNVGKGWTILH